MEKQIGYEFDFMREADAMKRIRRFLYENNKKPLVFVPRVIQNMVTKRVLVMDYIDGVPILKLGDEIAKRGINPSGKLAMVALIDYGQVKDLPENLRLGYANLVLAMADNDPIKASDSYRNALNWQRQCLTQNYQDGRINKAFPEELFCSSTVHLLSRPKRWIRINFHALTSETLVDEDLKSTRKRGIFRRMFGR
ncbi:hypothetical protein Leryth_019297 [Lithospermum erythrorhizon]|nr:hypothetical protein Leryth_019297 [Lithospermum erythrorhizon]